METLKNELAEQLGMFATTPMRTEMPKTPKDYGMDFENISFNSPDGINIAAWYIPSKTKSNKLIMMTHAMLHTRYGFIAPEGLKEMLPVHVEFQNTVKHLHENGYNVLFMDFRNHGESGEANNGVCGVSYYEWQDVVGMIDYVNADEKLNQMEKGFMGFCMGASSTIKAMGKAPEKFKDIKFLLAVQPISMRVFMDKVYKLNDPNAGTQEMTDVDNAIKNNRGFGLDDMSPADFIKDLKVPTMFVQLQNDAFTDPSDVQSFYDNTHSEKELLWLDGNHHRLDAFNYFAEKPEKMLDFVGKHFSQD